jgi:hypothetical protein
MTKPIIKIHNAATNEIIEREMNAAEFKQYEIDQAAVAADREAAATKAAEKTALLAKLGITDDEAKLLLS